MSEFGGRVQVRDTKKKREVVITNDETGMSKAYLIPYGSRIKVLDGDVLEAGDELTEGSVNPNDIMKIKGVRAVQDYMLREVQTCIPSARCRNQRQAYRGDRAPDVEEESVIESQLEIQASCQVSHGGYSWIMQDAVEKLDSRRTRRLPDRNIRSFWVLQRRLWQRIPSCQQHPSRRQLKVLTDAAIKGKVDPLIGSERKCYYW